MSMSTAYRNIRLPAIIGALVLSGTVGVMAAWVMRAAGIIYPAGGPAMVFNTALCFLLVALVLILNNPASPGRLMAQQLIGGVIALIAGLVGGQYWFGYVLGLDWPTLHRWLGDDNPYPGRMSKVTSVTFLAIGLTVILMHRARSLWSGLLVQALTAAVVATGVFGLAGLFLDLRNVYANYLFSELAPYTATGFVVSGLALWLCWREAGWYLSRKLIGKEHQRISLTGVAILSTVVFVSVVTGFKITQNGVVEVMSEGLQQIRKSKVDIFTLDIENRITQARAVATRPASITYLRRLNSQPDDAKVLELLRRVAESFLPLGVSAIAYYSPQGKEWLWVGHFTERPELTVQLSQPHPAFLMWGRGLVLKTRLPMTDDGEIVGTVVVEQALTALTSKIAVVSELGETGEIGMCVLRDGKLHCFPQRLRPHVYSIPYSELLPMSRAVAGKTGVVQTIDYRNQRIIAAYGPLGGLGLGLVAKVDTVEMYAPIRRQFEVASLLLFLTAAAGAFLLYWRIEPLARELDRSRELIRARGERALQFSERQLANLVESAMDAIISIDGAQRIVLVNNAAEKMFGYPSGEMLGQPLERLIPERSHVGYRQHIEAFGKTSITNRAMGTLGLVSGLRADGAVFPIEASISQTGMDEEKRYTAILRDITERKRAAEDLQKASSELRLMLKNMLNAFIVLESVFDENGRYVSFRFGYFNDAYTRIAGVMPEEVRGKDVFKVWPATEQSWVEVYGGVAVTGIPKSFDMYHAPTTGWYHCNAYRPTDSTAQVCVIFEDITERKQAEQRIRQQLEHMNLLDQITRSIGERLELQSIFHVVMRTVEDSLPVDFCCIGMHDQTTGTLRIERAGVKSEAFVNELILSGDGRIGVDKNGLGRCMQGILVYEPDIGEVRFPFPERLARRGLRSMVLAPLRSESRVFGVLVTARCTANGFSSIECEFLRQLSEHVALAASQAQLHGALQQAYDDLRQTQQAVMQEERLRALGQMASGIAHDINNALSPVSLYTDSLLETEPMSRRARGYLETIRRAIEDVSHTLARMREFYRQREPQLQLTPVDMNTLVQEVLDLTRVRWSDMRLREGITIRPQVELAPALPVIMGIGSELREALTNLVFNAVDAMPEGGTLTLRTRLIDAGEAAEYASVVIEVVDTGAGMDEDTRRRCLEPFFTTKGERGTGLGLAMVFGTVKRHGAALEIDTVPGSGTTVRLVFAVPAVDHAKPGQLELPADAPPPSLRLLLVDDDPILLNALRNTLEADGHVIVAENGGAQGISAFRASLDRGETFAAVVTDLGMPSVDGRKVAAAVKEASPATPVILLTGWGQRLVTEGDIPPYVDRVLAKPPKLRELREALAQLCQTKSA